MNKKELLNALNKAEFVFVPIFIKNGKDWRYVRADKKSIIDEVKYGNGSKYLVTVSELSVWFDVPDGVINNE
jgi:hypothetical protein